MTVLQELDSFTEKSVGENLPFRMPVQEVYKFTAWGDNRRIVAGTVESGTVSVGDEVVFYPSGKRTTVASVEVWNAPPKATAKCGEATGFTTGEQIYVRRGELATKADEPAPHVSTRFSANVFWLGKNPLITGKKYYIKIGTAKVEAEIERIISVLDSSNLEKHQGNAVNRNDIGEVVISCAKQVAFDLSSEMESTGRFVIVDDYEISGGGIIKAAM